MTGIMEMYAELQRARRELRKKKREEKFAERVARRIARRSERLAEPRHRPSKKPLEGPLRENEYPTVGGVRGSWLDDDGFVLPQFREKVAALRKQAGMTDIIECARHAEARR